MFDIADSLHPALVRAQHQLADAEGAVARSNAGAPGRGADAAMAQSAQAAIFDEALMNAVHARLNELKSVAR